MINLKDAFNYLEEDFLKFDRVESKLSNRPDLCAFLLLDKLCPGTTDIVGSAEHDEIWLDVDCERLAEVATLNDILTLVRCGVRYDKELDSLAMYV